MEMKSTSRLISRREASLIAPLCSDNERVSSCFLKKVLALKLRSVVLYVTCMRASAIFFDANLIHTRD